MFKMAPLRRQMMIFMAAMGLSSSLAALPAHPKAAALPYKRKQSTGLLTDQLQIGVVTHYGMHGESTKTFDTLVSTGARGLRDEAYWSHVEHSPGILVVPRHVLVWYYLAMRYRLHPLLLLSYANPAYQNGALPNTAAGRAGFARYAAFVARSLPGIQQFQIWNEWELKSPAGSPGLAKDYLALVSAVAPVLRNERPGALVLPAGVHRSSFYNGYLESLVRGGLLDHVDGIALHTYRFEQPDPSPEAWFTEINDLAARIAQWDPVRGGQANLYVTEMGFPSHWGQHGISEEVQADYLERCLLLALLVPRLRGFWWYGLRDKGLILKESEHHYGLLQESGQMKPSGLRLTELMERLKTVVSANVMKQLPGRLALRLERSDRSSWIVQWAAGPISDPVQPQPTHSTATLSSAPLPDLALGSRPVWTLMPPL